MQRLLEVGQARVRAAQHGHVLVRHAARVQRLHLLDDERTLEVVRPERAD